MSDEQPVINCPNCETRGQAKKKGTIFLDMTCPECEFNWQILSAKCSDCGKLNGYPSSGPCKSCYGKRKEAVAG